jgi:hypothetical protein
MNGHLFPYHEQYGESTELGWDPSNKKKVLCRLWYSRTEYNEGMQGECKQSRDFGLPNSYIPVNSYYNCGCGIMHWRQFISLYTLCSKVVDSSLSC